MSKHEAFTMNRARGHLVAAIFDSFIRIERENAKAAKVLGDNSFHENLDAGHAHWLTAALFISSQVEARLDPLVDFDAWADRIGGVFSYEHLEYNESTGVWKCLSLPAFLWRNLSLNQWRAAATDYEALDEAWLDACIVEWANKAGVPIQPLCVQEHLLSAEELRARYGDTQHPQYPLKHWRAVVLWARVGSGAVALEGYWPWVAHSLQTAKKIGSVAELVELDG